LATRYVSIVSSEFTIGDGDIVLAGIAGYQKLFSSQEFVTIFAGRAGGDVIGDVGVDLTTAGVVFTVGDEKFGVPVAKKVSFN
jgi:hypothetical protein